MRATEFLVENRTQWWANKYANEIWEQTKKPPNDWIIDQNAAYVYYPSNITLDKERVVKTVAEWIEDLDPTPNKKYTGWLIREYATGTIPSLEDVAFLGPMVGTYDRIKQRPDFPFERDILKLDSSQLFEVIDWWDTIKPKKALTDRGQSITIDDNAQYRAIMPLNQKAACYYGQGTRWCTAATESENFFSRYNNQSALLILLPKEPQYEKEKYQLHFAITLSAVDGRYTTYITTEKDLQSALEAYKKEPNQWQIRWGEFSNDKNENVGLPAIWARFGRETVMNTLNLLGEKNQVFSSRLTWQIEAIVKMYDGLY